MLIQLASDFLLDHAFERGKQHAELGGDMDVVAADAILPLMPGRSNASVSPCHWLWISNFSRMRAATLSIRAWASAWESYEVGGYRCSA